MSMRYGLQPVRVLPFASCQWIQKKLFLTQIQTNVTKIANKQLFIVLSSSSKAWKRSGKHCLNILLHQQPG